MSHSKQISVAYIGALCTVSLACHAYEQLFLPGSCHKMYLKNGNLGTVYSVGGKVLEIFNHYLN